MNDHTSSDLVISLATSITRFTAVMHQPPDALWLRRFTDWTPRDVVAHLIGWNQYTSDGSARIRRDGTPFYRYDVPSDFANLNAASRQAYPATDRAVLLRTLTDSAARLLKGLRPISAEDWTRDVGARKKVRRGSQW
jgi:hypothetical protein